MKKRRLVEIIIGITGFTLLFSNCREINLKPVDPVLKQNPFIRLSVSLARVILHELGHHLLMFKCGGDE